MGECLICLHVSEDFHGGSTSSVGKKGCTSLLNVSRLRNDELFPKFEETLFEMESNSKLKITVHKKCRQYYVEPNKNGIAAGKNGTVM